MSDITWPRMPTTRSAWLEEGAMAQGTSPLHLMLAWGFVGIPLVWGVIETLFNALKLFQ
jgi:hypothetical protein